MMNSNQSLQWEVSEIEVSYRPNRKNQASINSSQDCYHILRSVWDDSLMELQEQFAVLFLNRKNQIIGYRCIGTGNMVSTIVDKKLIAAISITSMACGVILCHNHPSGNLRPSQADLRLTKDIYRALKLVDVSVLDHLIISAEGYYSFMDEGILSSYE